MKKKTLVLMLIFWLIPSFLYTGLFLYQLQSNHMTRIYWEKVGQENVNQKKHKFMYVYNTVFPQAKNCAQTVNNETCIVEARSQLDANLHTELGGDTRSPLFFIRLQDDEHIEKLYQSGHYKVEKVDTQGEKMVVEILKGKRNPFAWPQYNCCGGDDILPDFPLFGKLLPTRVYLRDFPTEIEQVFLIRDDKEKIVGAIIALYGD